MKTDITDIQYYQYHSCTVAYLVLHIPNYISVQLESYFCPSGDCKASLHSFTFVFGLYQLLREISGSLAAKYAALCSPAVAAKCFCLSISAGQVVHSGVFKAVFIV